MPPKPDGTPRKQLDVSRLHALGWRHSHDLHDGLQRTYDWVFEPTTRLIVGWV